MKIRIFPCFLTHSRRRRSRHSSCRWQSSTSYRSWWSPSIVIFWSRRQSRRSSVNRQCYSARQAAVSETQKKKNKNKNAKRSTNIIPRSCRLWSGLVPGNAIDIIILLLYPLLERWSFFWDGETNFCRRQSYRRVTTVWRIQVSEGISLGNSIIFKYFYSLLKKQNIFEILNLNLNNIHNITIQIMKTFKENTT